jgi:large subunit ribosomal protein L18
MSHTSQKLIKRATRRNRIRAKVSGTAERPRLSVFRSNKAIYAQLIDDVAGKTLVAANNKDAATCGKDIASRAKAAGITSVVFDRGGFIYTGRVKVLADNAREGGLQF